MPAGAGLDEIGPGQPQKPPTPPTNPTRRMVIIAF